MYTLLLVTFFALAAEPSAPTFPVSASETILDSADDDGEAWCASPSCGACTDGLLGWNWLRPSDHAFECFVSPISNPLFFEDPRTLTEARLIFAHHKLPGALGGGDLDVVALHIRAALTERLSLVAAKDGFIFAGSDAPLDDGWNDVSVGLKYNLYRDVELQRLLSVGVSYELPVGSPRALQGNGDGEFLLYLTGGMQLDESTNWISAAGWRLPVDGSAESESLYWSNHIDTLLWWPGVYALAEVNWFHWVDSGNGGIPGVAGLDLFNFGSTNVTGNDVVTGAVGLKYKPHRHLELGVAWEIPLTGREDVLDNRLYVDAIFRY